MKLWLAEAMINFFKTINYKCVRRIATRFLLTFLLFIPITLSAQISIGARVGYGKFGANFEPHALNQLQRPLYNSNFGAVLLLNNLNNCGIQFECNYMKKGWTERDEKVEGSKFTRTLTYIEVPMFAHFELGKGSLRLIGYVGPYVGYKIADNTESQNFEASFIRFSRYNHYSRPVRDFDFGNKLGWGIRYNFGKSISILIDGRYDLQVAGGQNFLKKNVKRSQPDIIQASRLQETSLSFTLLWNFYHFKVEEEYEGYVPKTGL